MPDFCRQDGGVLWIRYKERALLTVLLCKVIYLNSKDEHEEIIALLTVLQFIMETYQL